MKHEGEPGIFFSNRMVVELVEWSNWVRCFMGCHIVTRRSITSMGTKMDDWQEWFENRKHNAVLPIKRIAKGKDSRPVKTARSMSFWLSVTRLIRHVPQPGAFFGSGIHHGCKSGRMSLSKQDDLLRAAWPWFVDARVVGANYSPGFSEVWMGRAHRIQ